MTTTERPPAVFLDRTIQKALGAAQKGRILAATDLLVALLDDLLTTNTLALARELLDKVDPHHFPPPVLTGLLTILSHAPDEIARTDFGARVRNALRTTWTWDEARVAEFETRLRRA